MVAPQRSASARSWLGRWIVVVTIAEALGFVLPAVTGALATGAGWFVPLLLAAGAVEGAALGAGQALVLRRRVPHLNRAAWIWLTAAAAVVAYAAGLVPSTFADVWTTWPWPAQAGLIACLAVVLLGSIGTAQWIELRRHVRRAAWWIAGTAVGWLIGLGVFFAIAPPLWHEGQQLGETALIGVVAGLLMATAMATVTGLTMVALLRHPAI